MLDPLTLSTLLAAVSTACLILFGLIDFKQWRALDKIETKIEAFQQQDIGESFGEWLLDKPAEDQATNLESCASLVGRQIAQSFSMGLKGMASGESRTVRSVEKAVLEGLQTPESKALMEFVDSIGVPRELAGIALNILQERGLLPQIMKNNGQGDGSSGWKV